MHGSHWILFSSHVRTAGNKEQAFHEQFPSSILDGLNLALSKCANSLDGQPSKLKSEKARSSYCIKVPEEESANQNNNQVVKNENTMGSPTQVTVNASNGGQVEYNVETKSHDDKDFKITI